MSEQNKQYARVEQIAQLFGLSVRRIQQLAQEGVFKSERVHGETGRQYPLIESVQAYIEYLHKKIGKRGQAAEALDNSKLLESALRQRKLAVEVALKEGRAYPVETVEAVMNDIVSTSRSRLRAIPLEVAPKLVSAPDEQTIAQILAEAIDDVCALISNYDKADFMARHPELVGTADEADSEDWNNEPADIGG